MEKEYRSVFCFCGGYERPAPVSPGALAERDHTSLAECGDEASLARSKSRNGRVVHSNCRASSSWHVHPVVSRRTRRRSTGARRRATEQAQGRNGREVHGDAAGRPGAVRRLAEASIRVGQSLRVKLICGFALFAVLCLLTAPSARPDASGESLNGVEAEFFV